MGSIESPFPSKCGRMTPERFAQKYIRNKFLRKRPVLVVFCTVLWFIRGCGGIHRNGEIGCSIYNYQGYADCANIFSCMILIIILSFLYFFSILGGYTLNQKLPISKGKMSLTAAIACVLISASLIQVKKKEKKLSPVVVKSPLFSLGSQSLYSTLGNVKTFTRSIENLPKSKLPL